LPELSSLCRQLDINHITWQKILDTEDDAANIPEFLDRAHRSSSPSPTRSSEQ
jgi:hypothetical protein